jgi:hypothetical protein
MIQGAKLRPFLFLNYTATPLRQQYETQRNTRP